MMTLGGKAEEVILKHHATGTVEIVSCGKVNTDGRYVYVVVVRSVGRGLHYEVWEVMFQDGDGIFDGIGTFGMVASTTVEELDYKNFEYEFRILDVEKREGQDG